MKALRIHAGPRARQHLERHGLQPADVGVIPAAAGGPKGLILGPLDRFIFGEWLPRSSQPVHLVGASIGAWRMATACLQQSVPAFERLEHDYIHQDYELPPGKKRPTAAHVSERFGHNLQAFYGGRVDEVLSHPRFHLHIVTSRGRHLLGREHGVATPLGYLGAFLTNTVHRKAMGAWLERVVFSSPDALAPGGGCAALPFGTSDYRTRQVGLSAANFMPALQASCSIPFVLQAVHNIPGAPPGAYWDGGITDYHLHLAYGKQAGNASNLIAARAYESSARGQKELNVEAGGAEGAGIVLYPHFQHRVVPGWLDKGLKWRHRSTPALDNMVVLSPNPDWVRNLPNAKLPDRKDFTHYGTDSRARAQAWLGATSASQQLVDEWGEWLQRPDMGAVHVL
ncbi:phospholipase [Acidovorax sp.]|uniref:phospholipase n=1 Tax=Acidovorax sp. TaxID=1872122 RepID=UPI002608EA9D|nr:phospholipase [Acidovorax sp.]